MNRIHLSSVLVVSVCTLLLFTSAQAFVAPSLGWWNEGVAGSTHQYWDFTPGYVTGGGGSGYTATPEQVINPDPCNVLATITPGLAWDGQGSFSSKRYLAVNLELPNWTTANPYKEIWVDLGLANGTTVNLEDIAVSAGPTNVAFRYEIIMGTPNTGYDFGVKIYPNPSIEKIQFVLFPPEATTALLPAKLDYIHVDTICIPEPMTLGLLALGGLALRRRLA